MPKTGLDALLRPEDSILVLIDHQPYQFTNLNSHEPTMVINNVIGLAKTAKVFNVPTILTTVIEKRGGYLIKGLSFRTRSRSTVPSSTPGKTRKLPTS
jgi:nicotinamidase-related amidase